jgi:hypothetical protein
MNAILDEEYFKWLYSQVGSPRHRNPAKTYWSLTRQLYNKEFIWIIPNDDNRLEDGKELRYEFLDISGLEDPDGTWTQMGCSMLELMIALSRRLSFMDMHEGDPANWFWHILDNVGLLRYNDRLYNPDNEKHAHRFLTIDETLDRIIWRTYEYDGRGGFFPLEESRRDQTEVELWYQLNSYMMERN